MLITVVTAVCEYAAWNCPKCGRIGETGKFCGGCGHPATTNDRGPSEKARNGIPTNNLPSSSETESKTRLQNVEQSVVRILTAYHITDERFSEYINVSGYNVGSGFAIGVPGEPVNYVATAGHVVMHNLESGNVMEPTVQEVIDGKEYYLKVQVDYIHVLISDVNSYIVANVEKVATHTDLAILKLKEDTLPREVAVIMDRRDFSVGEKLISMGFPAAVEVNIDKYDPGEMLSDTKYVTIDTSSFFSWRYNAETKQGDQIKTTSSILPGSSGGPMVDSNGYVVGVNISGSLGSADSGYAVASCELITLIDVSDINAFYGP